MTTRAANRPAAAELLPEHPGPQISPRAIGWAYDVDPWTGRSFSHGPDAQFDRGRIIRGYSVAQQLPWNPYSYPAVGRAPTTWPPPEAPTVPASGGIPGRKGLMGRARGSAATSPATTESTSPPGVAIQLQRPDFGALNELLDVRYG